MFCLLLRPQKHNGGNHRFLSFAKQESNPSPFSLPLSVINGLRQWPFNLLFLFPAHLCFVDHSSGSRKQQTCSSKRKKELCSSKNKLKRVLLLLIFGVELCQSFESSWQHIALIIYLTHTRWTNNVFVDEIRAYCSNPTRLIKKEIISC
jgi:hypothetical protein